MSTPKNIYVGKRYVPLQCGDWDNTKNTLYESLSVVLYQGSSYTSKQDVPKGIDITNILYWVKSADYNAQVAIYEQNVRDYHQYVISQIGLVNTAFDDFKTAETQRFDDFKTAETQRFDDFKTAETQSFDNYKESINSQMSEKANQSDLVTANYNITANTNAIALKANKTDVQNMSSQVQGFYATVSALTTAFSTGNTNNYVVTADNYIYRWNGSAWTSTGYLFNSTTLADGTISESKLTTDLDFKINQSKLLYDFTDEATDDYASNNGAIVDTTLRTITIPATYSGTTSFYRLTQLFNSVKYTGYTLRVYCQYTTSNSALARTKINMYMNVKRNGTNVNSVSSNLIKYTLDTNRYYYTIDYVIQSGDTAIAPYLQIVNDTPLTTDCTVTIEKMAYEIIPVSDIYTSNQYTLDEKLSQIKDSISLPSDDVTKIYNNPNDRTEVIFATISYDKVFLEITRGHNSIVRVYGQLSDGTYALMPTTNMRTGNSLNYIGAIGSYYIDTSQYNNIKFINSFADLGTSNLQASVYTSTDKLKTPLQIIGGNYNQKSPNPILLNRIGWTGTVLTANKGKLYAVNGNIILSSANWGTDGFTTTVGTVTGATSIYKMLILDNDNILVWDTGGKVYLSTDNFATWTVVLDLGLAPTHQNFGANAYGKYVMMCEYSNVINTALRVYISSDYGVTFHECFNVYNSSYGFTYDGVTKIHTHSCAIDPFETTIDGKPMLWVTTGDGSTGEMYFWSKDFGVTWNKVAPIGYGAIQATEIIPLRNCVLFLSDSRLVSVMRYNRPVTGTHVGQSLSIEMAFNIFEGWGKSTITGVPLGVTSAIDYSNSKAYFGFGNTSVGNDTNDSLKYGQIYTTDGYSFYQVFKRDTLCSLSYVWLSKTDNDKSIIARVNSDTIRLNGDMWD